MNQSHNIPIVKSFHFAILIVGLFCLQGCVLFDNEDEIVDVYIYNYSSEDVYVTIGYSRFIETDKIGTSHMSDHPGLYRHIPVNGFWAIQDLRPDISSAGFYVVVIGQHLLDTHSEQELKENSLYDSLLVYSLQDLERINFVIEYNGKENSY